ncbi:hypothetical protein RJG79_10580 [Mycoplasmatota bacterium WC44]
MIMDISDYMFNKIVSDESFHLPRRWDGDDFYTTIDLLYKKYINLLSKVFSDNEFKDIEYICNNILKSISHYHMGYPSKAFDKFSSVMKRLKSKPLTIYRKSGWINIFENDDPLKLYRIRNVQNNISYKREHIFHTPYNLRSKVSSCRYSISGYPSLYLGTSLELCIEETKIKNITEMTIVSRYKIERSMLNNERIEINVLELGIKPQDFLLNETNEDADEIKIDSARRKSLNEVSLNSDDVKISYLYWYPLIAASSFIRVNKIEPFASEYIIPQLVMQWVRNQYKKGKLIGIRYFSCASNKASELGFNYVFPVSGQTYYQRNYCNVLANSFRLTKPYYIHEFNDINHCEETLTNDMDLDKI